MSFAILGLGTALPPYSLTQERAAMLTSRLSGHSDEQTRRLAVLYRRTGIRQRHVAILEENEPPRAVDDGAQGPSTCWRMRRYDEAVRPLALDAASKALGAAAIGPEKVTHLVTVSCTGFSAPGFDLGLIKDLALRPTVERTHIGFMGCHGALNGLRVAKAFAGCDPEAHVLLCAAELCSLHFRQGSDSERSVANALFADGAAAIVGRASPQPDHPPWSVVAGGSCLAPDTGDAMGWTIGDHGFEMTLSPKVAAHIGTFLRPWIEAWLDRHGLDLRAIASWAIHPGGPRILEAVVESLGLEAQAAADSREVFAACGNMSSPTILFILDRLRRRAAPLPCVALAFGPGLVVEAALLA